MQDPDGCAATLLGWRLELGLEDAVTPISGAAEDVGPATLGGKARVLQRLIADQRPYTVQVRLAGDLHAALEPGNEDSELRAELDKHLPRIRSELGLHARRAIDWQLVPQLAPGTYQIVVNGLPRATAVLPVEATFRAIPGAAPAGTQIVPWSGRGGIWLQGETPAAELGERDFTAPAFLVRHIGACLSEAIGEFADLDWTNELLRQLEWSPLGKTLRQRYDVEFMAATFEILASDGIPMLDSRLLEGLLEYPAEAVVTPRAVAQFLWMKLGQTVAAGAAGVMDELANSSSIPRTSRPCASTSPPRARTRRPTDSRGCPPCSATSMRNSTRIGSERTWRWRRASTSAHTSSVPSLRLRRCCRSSPSNSWAHSERRRRVRRLRRDPATRAGLVFPTARTRRARGSRRGRRREA